jgi:hypothetical protein
MQKFAGNHARPDTTHAGRSYEASREGNVRYTMVPALPLSRAI